MHNPAFTTALGLFSLIATPGQVGAEPLQRIEVREFGKLPDGRAVQQFTLRNSGGMVTRFISYGAIITEIEAPDRTGALTNVLLGATTLEQYLRGANAAAVIGRVANRIAKARFTDRKSVV